MTLVEWTPEADERAALAELCRPIDVSDDVEAVLALSDALSYCVGEVSGFVAALRDAGENHCGDACAHALKRAMDRAETALAMYAVPSCLRTR